MSDLVPPALPFRISFARLTLFVVVVGTVLVGIYSAAIALSGPLLDIGTVPGTADVMVVVGGDGPARANRALELWRQHPASRVLVSGDGDCTSIAAALVKGGVPQSDIATECQSRNTWENAEFSAPILTSYGAHTAVIVTNWFHARRALASFEAVCPGMSFAVASVPSPSFAEIATGPYGLAVAEEYFKTIWYDGRLWLRDHFGAQESEDRPWTPC